MMEMEVKSMKKVTIRKAGSVRLTSAATALYCGPCSL
jgi:hypothetical protein